MNTLDQANDKKLYNSTLTQTIQKLNIYMITIKHSQIQQTVSQVDREVVVVLL